MHLSLNGSNIAADIDNLVADRLGVNKLDLTSEELMKLVQSRARRHFTRGLKRKPMALIKRLRKAKKAVTDEQEKPAVVKSTCVT
jgi:hypothetical protein